MLHCLSHLPTTIQEISISAQLCPQDKDPAAQSSGQLPARTFIQTTTGLVGQAPGLKLQTGNGEIMLGRALKPEYLFLLVRAYLGTRAGLRSWCGR